MNQWDVVSMDIAVDEEGDLFRDWGKVWLAGHGRVKLPCAGTYASGRRNLY